MGPLACLLSAVGFGLMAVLASLSYDDGVGLDAFLLVRFGLAGVVLVALAQAQGRLRHLTRRTVVTALLMGGVGYVAQAGLYLSALRFVDASQVALVFCCYPLLVMVSAVLTRRERASGRRVAALGVALVGVALVLGGAGSFDPVGSALAFGAAVVYTGYILVGDRVRADPIAFAAVVCCGATGTLLASSAVRGLPDLALAPRAWLWLVLVALACTVAPIIAFFVGLARVGPSVASLLSLLEPVVTVGSAALVLGEALGPWQVAGGACVLASAAVVQWPARARRRRSPLAVAGWPVQVEPATIEG
ncbi:DMT family transporter [Nocardioides marmoribigeumensis]|jgi:drug/metabolite transporter (DMT)-like permease|uniref:Drug/metabolite transporter (DMT)-like permease n=1 Tax=Nocardioides marmoribigeumensis TaxID=433649 RepID=A0ABU2C0J9_9ACTN|nr:DMT family transporter [Nocardioides marmoribigeumensis]MDR7364185.1 drug/metabolite transporter (DMT)-like permease [Nocardioides marmoribigeumensis]